MYLFIFFLFLSLAQFFGSYFSKKLLVLLSLEALMLILILFFYLYAGEQSDSFLVPLILSIFMVLDSVFCVSFLISVTRCSSLEGNSSLLSF